MAYDVTGYTTRRFVLSFLSKDRVDEAFKGEMICDEQTGEIFIRTPSGDVVPYSSPARYYQSITTITSYLDAFGYKGKLYNVSIDDYQLPSSIPSATNLLQTPITIDDNNDKVFVFFDCDAVSINEDGVSYDLNTDIAISININGTEHTMPLYDISSKMFDKPTDEPLSITDIHLIRNNNKPTRMILHSLIIATAR